MRASLQKRGGGAFARRKKWGSALTARGGNSAEMAGYSVAMATVGGFREPLKSPGAGVCLASRWRQTLAPVVGSAETSEIASER